ncbi:hypothetical protein JCM5353_006786 [Sporobolomyces roseus]
MAPKIPDSESDSDIEIVSESKSKPSTSKSSKSTSKPTTTKKRAAVEVSSSSEEEEEQVKPKKGSKKVVVASKGKGKGKAKKMESSGEESEEEEEEEGIPKAKSRQAVGSKSTSSKPPPAKKIKKEEKEGGGGDGKDTTKSLFASSIASSKKTLSKTRRAMEVDDSIGDGDPRAGDKDAVVIDVDLPQVPSRSRSNDSSAASKFLGTPEVLHLVLVRLDTPSIQYLISLSHNAQTSVKNACDDLEHKIKSDSEVSGIHPKQGLADLVKWARRLTPKGEDWDSLYERVDEFGTEQRGEGWNHSLKNSFKLGKMLDQRKAQFWLEIVGYTSELEAEGTVPGFPVELLFLIYRWFHRSSSPSFKHNLTQKMMRFLLLPLHTLYNLALAPYLLSPLSQVRAIVLGHSHRFSSEPEFSLLFKSKVLDKLRLLRLDEGPVIYHLGKFVKDISVWRVIYDGVTESWGPTTGYTGEVALSNLNEGEKVRKVDVNLARNPGWTALRVVHLPGSYICDFALSRFQESLAVETSGALSDETTGFEGSKLDEAHLSPLLISPIPPTPLSSNLAYPFASPHETSGWGNPEDAVGAFTFKLSQALSSGGIQRACGVTWPGSGCCNTTLPSTSYLGMDIQQFSFNIPPTSEPPARVFIYVDPSTVSVRVFAVNIKGQRGGELVVQTYSQETLKYWFANIYRQRKALDPDVMGAQDLEKLVPSSVKSMVPSSLLSCFVTFVLS